MILDKLHIISDEDAKEVGFMLLKDTTSDFYNFSFKKIVRTKYNKFEGSDAEESVKIYFKCKPKSFYKKIGYKKRNIIIKLVEKAGFWNSPHIYGLEDQDGDKIWGDMFLYNHIKAIEFLQSKSLI